MCVVNKKYRIDLELVDAKGLTVMQTKLNQWITAQTLLKFDVTAIGDKMLFRVVRLREVEQATVPTPAAAPAVTAKTDDNAPF